MSVINSYNNISVLQFMSVFMWVDILSSLVIYWTTSDDVYLHRRGRGADLYMVSGTEVLMFNVMASNYTMFAFTLITCLVNMMYLQII